MQERTHAVLSTADSVYGGLQQAGLWDGSESSQCSQNSQHSSSLQCSQWSICSQYWLLSHCSQMFTIFIIDNSSPILTPSRTRERVPRSCESRSTGTLWICTQQALSAPNLLIWRNDRRSRANSEDVFENEQNTAHPPEAQTRWDQECGAAGFQQPCEWLSSILLSDCHHFFSLTLFRSLRLILWGC